MAKVTIIQVVYNNCRYIEPVFSAMFGQTFKDLEIVAVIAGNDDKGKELLADKFPKVKIIDPGYNIGFAKGHNLVFGQCDSKFFQLVNPDLVMEPDYVEKMVKAMESDPKIGAATGKLYQITESGIRNYELWKRQNTERRLDTTGVAISKSGRARDRGQHETDKGQYDNNLIVPAVSAAGAMYRRSALEAVKMPILSTKHLALSTNYEYFDEDFHSYWEDADLAWRMTNAGWECAYVPAAVAYHGRGAGSSKGGYKKVFSYIKFHRQLPQRIRQLNYQNHIFMYVKNSEKFYLRFFARELFMLVYILLFEASTLKIFPNFLKLLPKMRQKRRLIRMNIKSGRTLYS
ncbi:MAG: glycosyltransferase family 2 protein [Patescibacteria group bacterium]|nr:glycosyltransferase family 2 protein [Patescibacteria group bacterium]